MFAICIVNTNDKTRILSNYFKLLAGMVTEAVSEKKTFRFDAFLVFAGPVYRGHAMSQTTRLPINK